MNPVQTDQRVVRRAAEEIEEPIMQEIRYLDKLIDELPWPKRTRFCETIVETGEIGDVLLFPQRSYSSEGAGEAKRTSPASTQEGGILPMKVTEVFLERGYG